MRFKLRYQHRDIELPPGEFAIGRHASCHLALEDPLVSRRHALLRHENGIVTVSDAGSRNGVLVNGERIPGETELKSGDTLLIGSQEVTFFADQSGRNSANYLKRTLPRVEVAMALPDLGGPRDGELTSMAQMQTGESRASGKDSLVGEDFELSVVRKLETFSLVGGVAEKALAMGKTQDAERMLTAPLNEIMESIRGGRRVTASLVDSAARLAAKLAVATGKGSWADFVVELYTHQRRPFPAPVVEELSNALRKVSSFDRSRFRAYLDELRTRSSLLTPAERFLLGRIEGLERIAALR